LRKWQVFASVWTAGVAAAALVAWSAGTSGAATVRATAALGSNWYGSAPYYYTLDSSAPDLATVMSATGQKAFELAFILAPSGGGCTPTWDGTDTVSSDTQVAAVINEVRAAGGDVSVSAGGYGGTKLGQVCGSASATAAAYQQVITKYGLHAIDFDLEEPEIENTTAIGYELGAAQILQANNPGLYVSVTIPSTATGANYFGQLLISQAKSIGFTPNNFSIMPFDGGFSGASSQITALQDFNAQLVSTYGWSSGTAYAHEGFSGMNGRTDSAEYFYQADFQSVLSFAESNGMSRYTFWDVNRDRECNPVNNGVTSGECSSVTQNAYDFTKYTTQFAGATPPTGGGTTTTTTTSGGGGTTTTTSGGGGSCVAAWVSTTAYSSGQEVSYNGHNWTANQWNYNEVPGGASGAWNDDGAC
jgi:chitinase